MSVKNAIDRARAFNKKFSQFFADDCCEVDVLLKSETFTDQTSLTITHRLGKVNQFRLFDTAGQEFSATITDDGTTATIDFGGSTLSGTVNYWVKA